MKFRKLLILSIAAMMLGGCTNSSSGNGAGPAEDSGSTGGQQGGEVHIEDGDYYKGEGFVADNEAYADMVSIYKKPSVRFLEENKYQVALIYAPGATSKTKMVVYGNYEVSTSGISLNMEGYRMNNMEQSSSMPYVFSLTASGNDLMLQMTVVQTVEGQTMQINLAHATLTKSEFRIAYTINGQYHFTGIEEISPYTIADEYRAELEASYSVGELYSSNTKVMFTFMDGPDYLCQYNFTVGTSGINMQLVSYYDFDGELLSSYTPNGSITYSYQKTDSTFKFSSLNRFWVCYSI